MDSEASASHALEWELRDVQPSVRLAVRKLVRASLPDTPVMSFLEVPEDKAVEVVAVIGAPERLAA